MNRREQHRAAREEQKKAVTYNMTLNQVMGIAYDESEKARKDGILRGMRVTLEACQNAYGVVLAETFGMTPDQILKAHQTVNDEVFRQIHDGNITLEDVREFAGNCGVPVQATA
jgi:hypothetical protein